MKGLMRSVGFAVEVFSSAEEFLRSAALSRTGFLIVDVNMPNMSGLRLHENLLLQGKVIQPSLSPRTQVTTTVLARFNRASFPI